MAATSHDFWLAFLTPAVWKALHMGLYAAYGLVVMHVALGAMQFNRTLFLPLMLAGGFGAVAHAAYSCGPARAGRSIGALPAATTAGWWWARRNPYPTRRPGSWRRRTASASRSFATAGGSAR